MKSRLLFIIVFIIFASCSGLRRNTPPKKEFRGVWVATVANIDWPENRSDDSQKQKSDFLRILDFYEQHNFNVLIVQIRTAGDAFYPSEYAPWSRFLTGKEGAPKQGLENPLQWMIAKTHERGMQFHAWLNPYRATFDLDTTILARSHDFYKRRDWMVRYGKKWYYNPGEPEVWKHLTKVVEEVVANYAVDGIHFDDYFYPYKIAAETFNDTLAFTRYRLPGQRLEDWRRSNVDSLVKNVHQAIIAKKPWVQFGISPFGVWKNNTTDPKGSDTKAGQTTYEDLYADPLLWMQKGWLNYIVPQAYWSMDYTVASHSTIARWWANKSVNTNLYMGNGAYKIRNNPDKAWSKKKELPKQIALGRSLIRVKGNVFFSAKSLPQHPDVAKLFQKKIYRSPVALPPHPLRPRRILRPPVIISREQIEGHLNICLSHYDSIPSYLSIYHVKGTSDITGEVLKKVYLPADQSVHCFGINSAEKKLKFKIIDGFGNESRMIAMGATKK
ncbi:MAG: family 10 glycosylhydrolase [Bacteroidota bacterium]